MHIPLYFATHFYQKHYVLSCEQDPSHRVSPSNTPTNAQLDQELLAVFGQDSLWERTLKHQVVPKKKLGRSKTKHKKTVKSTASDPISASIDTLKSFLPFQNDIDLGANSDSDIYVQFLAKKKWVLRHDISLDTQQLFRYGADSKNYSETTLNLNQTLHDNTLFSNRFNLNKSQNEAYTWENRTFQQYQFLKNQQLVYGVYSGGVYDQEKKDWEVQTWGPYLSWRRPLWRDWIFINNQLSYYHDTTVQKNANSFATQVQFEANF